MNNENRQRHMVDMLFVISLLFMFALGAITLIALGASVYKRGVSTMQKNYDDRTAYSYITEKLRQYDFHGSFDSAVFNKQGAISIKSVQNGVEYVTYIYEYDSKLMEITARADAGELLPESGQPIAPIKDLHIEAVKTGMLAITITLEDDQEITFVAARRSQEAE